MRSKQCDSGAIAQSTLTTAGIETKQMNDYPDFSQHGYQVIAELGRNYEGGRITYKANALSLDKFVVIKEFCFAASGANWSGYKAYEREIEVIQQLSHPRIPHYLDSFETPQGFCLVQEYKNAPTLGERHSYEPEQIKKIAVSVLEILVYLQKRTPPIIHRDIKPENILVDEQLNAYLVDFGFARIRGGEVALSSVAAGTPGFMPPEEMFNRPLTEASDLYSLGVTLLGLLTGTRSVDIGKLIDDNYRLNFKSFVPQLNPDFIDWLEKMVASNVKERYPNAAVALETLKPIDVVGNAIKIKTPARKIKLNKAIAVLGLITIGVVAWGEITARLHLREVRQLQTINACVQCNLEKANLGGADLLRADLRGANLGGANLGGAYLGGAKLGSAYLGGANLGGADLKGANLGSANLGGAYLGGANLKGADLASASLGGADLRYADLRYAKLGSANLGGANLEDAFMEGAELESAYLRYANLRSAELEGANLKGANLGDATLVHANLRSANLKGATLGGANLVGATLWYANLGGANLGGANLGSAELQGANLKGANLKGANLKGANLKDAIMPNGTKHK